MLLVATAVIQAVIGGSDIDIEKHQAFETSSRALEHVLHFPITVYEDICSADLFSCAGGFILGRQDSDKVHISVSISISAFLIFLHQNSI